MSATDTSPMALLDWSLTVDCPSCGEEIDLVAYDADRDYILAEYIFSNNWQHVKGHDVTCPKCSHAFTLAGVEY